MSLLNVCAHSLSQLPPFSDDLEVLNCNLNNLTEITSLPSTLKEIHCCCNPDLATLPALPSSLLKLHFERTSINVLPPLPSKLQSLICSRSKLTFLPPLPPSLKALCCNGNNITTLPELPDGLEILACDHNPFTTRRVKLPNTLSYLQCDVNQLAALGPLAQGFRLTSSWEDSIMVYQRGEPDWSITHADPRLKETLSE